VAGALQHGDGGPAAEDVLFGTARAGDADAADDHDAVPWLRVARQLSGLRCSFTLASDHKPPHIHISVLGRKHETCYLWPDLRPLPANPALSRSDEESLRAYVQRRRKEIEAKVKSLPWAQPTSPRIAGMPERWWMEKD
jgi:hypothetical protein